MAAHRQGALLVGLEVPSSFLHSPFSFEVAVNDAKMKFTVSATLLRLATDANPGWPGWPIGKRQW
jgi:hypothetical protein